MKKTIIAAIILPVQVISNTTGVATQNNVSATAQGGTARVESNVSVSGSSQNSVVVSTSESLTTTNGESKVYKKIDIEVNGKKKTLETNEAGSHSLSYEDGEFKEKKEATKSPQLDELADAMKPTYHYKTISPMEYVLFELRQFFSSLFSRQK